MQHEIEVEIFRTGDYGARGRYGENDLDRIAEDYSPDVHEAPVTVDHKQNGPALGWVRALRRAGQVLMARIGGLDEAFREQLRNGAFKKRSVEIYRNAEATGRPYLRALSFLGAASPVVKGLADPVFAEAKTDTPDIPGSCVWIAFDENEVPTPAPEPEASSADEVTETFGEIDDETRRDLDALDHSGCLLPAWREMGIERFFASLDDSIPRAFSEDEEADPMTARDWFRRFLAGLAPMVPFGEAAPGLAEPPRALEGLPGIDTSDPRATRLDPRSVALHEGVMRYRDDHPDAAYAEALRAVCMS